MPTSRKDVKEFFERITALEVQVKSLMMFNKWQMGLLAAIVLLAMKNWIR